MPINIQPHRGDRIDLQSAIWRGIDSPANSFAPLGLTPFVVPMHSRGSRPWQHPIAATRLAFVAIPSGYAARGLRTQWPFATWGRRRQATTYRRYGTQIRRAPCDQQPYG